MATLDALEALRERNFRNFFFSQTVNRLGSMMTPVTLTFAVLHIDNSPEALSKVLAAEIGANVLCVLFGGVVADRFSRRLVLQTSYLSMALIDAAIALLMFTGRADITNMVVLGALAGGVGGFSMPAMQGIVPQLVSRAHLQQANSLMSLLRNSGSFIGPVIGTIVVASVGPQWAFVVDAMTFVAASVLLLGVVLPRHIPSHESIFVELREGWDAFRSRKWLWVIVVAFGALNAIHSGAWAVIGPSVAKNTPSLGIPGWGLVLGAEAVGMIVMSLILLRWKLTRPLLTGMFGVALLAIPFTLLGLHPVTLPLVAATFISGMGIETFGTGWNVAMMENVPQELLSRVFSYDMLGSFVAMPVGMLVFGWLATIWPPREILLGSAVAYLLIALSTLLVRDVRTLGRAPEEPVTPQPQTTP